ncbi:MAG TPA: hypothetical protein VK469_13865 [Candidatus Kapabacteria bacterium]|nr:hypothetical protein [Candidatus Kapabacteria bacterium]
MLCSLFGLSPNDLSILIGAPAPSPRFFSSFFCVPKEPSKIVEPGVNPKIPHLRVRRSQMKQRKEIGTVFTKVPPSFLGCSFLFAHPKRNEPKKKDAGNENFSLFLRPLHIAIAYAAPRKRLQVRAISGLPARR